MTIELTILAYAALLQVVQFGLMSIALNLQLGPKITAGPRDTPPEISGIPGRLYRAFNNHFEGLIMFTIAVVIVTLGQQSSGTTQTCAYIYLGARVLYIPAYISGIFMLRTSIWFVGFGATVVMIVASLI